MRMILSSTTRAVGARPVFGPLAQLASLALAFGLLWGCNLDVAVPNAPVTLDVQGDGLGLDGLEGELPVAPLTGKGVGEVCEDSLECRLGLACDAGHCAPGGATPLNMPCVMSGDCAAGLSCSLLGICAPAGEGEAGDACASGADCLPSMRCAYVGLSGVCEPGGDVDLDQACGSTSDCFAGLVCNQGGICQAGNVLYGADLFFPGVVCAEDDTITGPARVFFELPREGDALEQGLGEFYRLPFPNDARLRDGHVDLSGHAVPGEGILGFDIVARLIDAIESDMSGFGTNTNIVFRSTAQLDFGTIVATGADKSVRMVDIDPDSPNYGDELDLAWFGTTERGKYICRNSLTLHRPWSRPLRAGTTYAVVLTSALKTAPTKDDAGNEQPGVPLTPDDDFTTMLSSGAPSDVKLQRAWEAHRPLRDWLTSSGLPVADVVGGTVFTTAPVLDAYPRLRAAVAARPDPVFDQWTTCAAGVTSPCDDGLSGEAHVRGCFEEYADAYELHALVNLPVFQEGTRPYLQPKDGGAVVFDGDQARVFGEEQVCVSLSIPKTLEMPEGGWPALLYAHGTGGSFRNPHKNGVARGLARVESEGEEPVGMVVLGYDGVMHGPRRESDLDPEMLVYNFVNPRAARGNFLQAAGESFALVRALAALEIPAEASPTGAAIRVDPEHIYFMGHSQGGTSGPLFVPFEPQVPVAVYSGAGGSLSLSLQYKVEPVPILDGVRFALQDPKVGGSHPVLNLVQMYFDAVDPLNTASRQFAFPDEGAIRHHVLQTYGLGDAYTPPDSIRAFAGAMFTTLAEPVLDPIGGLSAASAPISGNWGGTTAVTAEYQPGDYDGHFVIFRHAEAKRQFQQFLASAIRTGTPVFVP